MDYFILFFVVAAPVTSVWYLRKYLETKIEEHIRFQYIKKQKAEKVAELFALWIKYRGNETTLLTKKEQIDYFETLNKLSMELFLWIPEKKLVEDIMLLLCRSEESTKNVRDIIADVRQMLHENIDSGVKGDTLVLWPRPDLEKELFS